MNPTDLAVWAYHSGSVFRASTAFTPGDYAQRRLDYDGSNNLIYDGVAPRSAASSDTAWIIQKYTYSGNNLILVQTSLPNQIWDNRAGLTYA